MRSILCHSGCLVFLFSLVILPGALAQSPQPPGAEAPALDHQDAASVAHAHNLSRAFRRAANSATPAVVAITARSSRPAAQRGHGDQLQQMPPEIRRFFEQFGGDFQLHPFGDGSSQPAEGTGSGVIIDPRGIVLTNNHVVQGADELIVQLADGRRFKGTDIKTDPLTDLAIFSLKGADKLTAIRIGRSKEMNIGDWVIAIGSPFELHHTVSAGIISGKGRSLAAARRSQFLQTDAAINPGNSGGPLVNLEGELIGINTAIASRSGGYNGIGFAIPSDTVSWVLQGLLEKGLVERAYLGVQIQEMTADLGKQFGLPRRGGVIVAAVVPGSPGHAAGLVPGDVITHFGQTPVSTPSTLQSTVERSPLAVEHPVRILRDGEPMTVMVTLAVLPTANQVSSAPPLRESAPLDEQSVTSEKLGLTVIPDSGDAEGVRVSRVSPGSLASQAGIPAGCLLESIDRQPVRTTADFAARAAAVDIEQGVMLQIRTPGGSAFIVLRRG